MPFRWITLTLLAVLAGGTTARAEERPIGDLASRIDELLAIEWSRSQVSPAATIDDAGFLRRVSLDLIGRIPTVSEVRAFLANGSPKKREQLVDRLLNSPAHARHLAVFWRRVWIPQADTPEFARMEDEIHEWLSTRLRENAPYDAMVRELLIQPSEHHGRTTPNGGVAGASRFFYAASEFKPENLAANTTRAFLGLNLECAQCHDHPFSRWTRDEFWQTAAFFARPLPKNDSLPVRLELSIANTDRMAVPKLLGGSPAEWPAELHPETGPRILAAWVGTDRNPFLARNAVNRLWAYFFGAGLIEPLDDVSLENSANHPELLEELSAYFVQSGYDLRSLERVLVTTRAYQLSSVRARSATDRSGEDRPLFDHFSVRGMTGEQLYDSLYIASGLNPPQAVPENTGPGRGLNGRLRFLSAFRVERPAQLQRSILQSLAMMNGSLTVDLIHPEKSPMVNGAASAPFLSTRGRIEMLYLAALGRLPDENELRPLVEYVESRETHAALADLLWALVNSSEFTTNH